jgi:hypothetical protein
VEGAVSAAAVATQRATKSAARTGEKIRRMPLIEV